MKSLAPLDRDKVFEHLMDTHRDLGLLYSLCSVALDKLTGDQAADATITKTRQLLRDRLCSDEYLNFDEACCGVQKRGQGGKNGYTAWGDGFLMEGLNRELKGEEIFGNITGNTRC